MSRVRLAVCFLLFCSAAAVPLNAQCPAGSTIPSVHICSPANGSTVGTEVNVTATAISTSAVSAIKVYVDGVSVYTFHDSSIDTNLVLSTGSHHLTVKAWDSTGGVFSSAVTVTASDGSTPPPPPPPPNCAAGATNTVNLCSPVSGSNISSPVDVEAYVNATVSTVKIYVDGVSKWSGTSQKVSASLAMTAGSHKVTVQAWTSSGTIIKPSATFSVSSGGSSPPPPPPPDTCTAGSANTMKICSPVSGTTVSSPVDIEAYVNSSSAITATKIYVDGTSAWSGTSAKISASLSLSNGSHKFTVKAWNTAGVILSSSVTATVGAATTPQGLTISPRRFVTTPTVPVQFTASGATTWSVDGVEGGSSTSGTIDGNGLFTPAAEQTSHTITASNGTDTATATVYISSLAAVATYKYDNFRTGANKSEWVLNPLTVNTSSFGKLMSFPLDGNSFGQPVYMAGVNVAGKGIHNVVFLATAHDSVYAFDADAKSSTPLWQVSFLNAAAGVTTYPPVDACCVAEVGITSTMAINKDTNTLYVVAATKENTSYVYRLHALDLTSGAERAGSPVAINASVPGTGDSSTGGMVRFDPYYHLQRGALLLANGNVYIMFASFNDVRPYHGWMMAYDMSTLQQVGVFCVTPNGSEGGMWAAGGGPTVDDDGNIYVATGNGSYTAPNGGKDYSQSVMKLDQNLNVVDYFTPYNWDFLDRYDRDIGSSDVMLLPSVPEGAPEHLAVNFNKGGSMYVINYDAMGKLDSSSNDQIFQTVDGFNLVRATPAYWQNSVYVVALDSPLIKMDLSATGFSTTPSSQTSLSFPYPGAAPVVSSNGSSGIVWAMQHGGSSAVIYAFDATDLSKQLWSSSTTGSDTADISIRFSIPMIANGRMYQAGKTQLVIYGLRP